MDRCLSTHSTNWAASAASEEQPTAKDAGMAPELNGAGSNMVHINRETGDMHDASSDSSSSTAPSMGKPVTSLGNIQVCEPEVESVSQI